MVCASCGEKNRDTARFCMFCGGSLGLNCAVCDTELVAGARFCDSCGTPVGTSVPAEPAAVAARKTVTVMFSDLTGSTALEERLDAESVRSILDRFYAALRTETERHGGRVVKFTGDGAMSVFGVPDVHEDDASRAVDAALAMRAECELLASDLGLQLSLKIGVNTGEVVVSESDADVVGDCVNVAARLEGAATAGEILVGEETWRLTRASSRYETIAPLALKGKSEPVPAWRLLAVDERTADSAAAPFVGRESELGRALAVFEDAVSSNGARLVTIIGSPGLGKTRLARELMSELEGEARVRETRCEPTGSTFAPIADALRGAASITDAAGADEVLAALHALIPIDDPDRDRIASRAAAILGVGEPGTTEETFWALRRIIEVAAGVAPVVLVLDDLHWAEPVMLDLVEHLAEWIRDAPVLIVATGRPELRDLRPSLVEGGKAAAVIALEGLNESATAQLALNLLGAESLPGDLLAKIPASTEGNPLFVRELVRMLVDDGVLLRSGDGWTVTVDVDAIEVPPTIQSLLAARVDRLRADERTFIELAAVVGKEFYRGALQELAPSGIRDQLDGCLESLRRKELIEPSGTYWIDEPVYHFHHALIRDAAYRRVLKESRAEMHERVAEWLERKTRDVLGEHDELIGYHLEQAHEYKSQLGRDDDVLAQRASVLLGSAAIRALDRDDLPAAASLSGRALDRLPREDPSRAEQLLVRCEALLSMGDVASGASAVSELERVADSARLAAWARCFAGHLANLTSPERLQETEKLVAAAAEELAGLGDQAGAAKGHTVHAATLARLGRFAECESVLDAGLNAARDAHDRRRITAVLGAAPHATLWGPNPVSRAGGRCLDIVRLLRITTGSPAVEATSTRCQAVLEAFRGRDQAARKMLRNARRTLEELGLRHEILEADLFAGIIELVSGDPSAAVPHLRTAYDGFLAEGVDVLAAQSAALLARAHLSFGEEDEAQRFADESEALGGQDLKTSIAWRAVKAELLARRGRTDEARQLADAAVEIASKTDALMDHADACRSLAVVLHEAGDQAGARAAHDRAMALYERKGATAFLMSGEEPPASSSATETPHTEDTSALRANRAFRTALVARDLDALASVFALDCKFEDRRLGLQALSEGHDEVLRYVRTAVEVGARDVHFEVVATRGDRLALAKATFSGDAFEVHMLHLVHTDAEGLIWRGVFFDDDNREAALAELDRLYEAERSFDPGDGSALVELGHFASGAVSDAGNTASRMCDEILRRVVIADWDGFDELFSEDTYFEDLRPGMANRSEGRAVVVENFKAVYAVGVRRIDTELLATWGDRLAMLRGRYSDAEVDFHTEIVVVVETNAAGEGAYSWAFEGLDQALDLLAERYGAGEGEHYPGVTRVLHLYSQAVNAADVALIRSVIDDDILLRDHRPASWGEIRGAAAFMRLVASGYETIGQRKGWTSRIHEIAQNGYLVEARVEAITQDGNRIDQTRLALGLLRDGKLTRIEYFPLDKLEEARARFRELTETAEGIRENSASRVVEAFRECMVEHDWDRLASLVAHDVRHEDQRSGMSISLRGREDVVANMRMVSQLGASRIDNVLLATRGDRLSLSKMRFRTDLDDEYEVELFRVCGANEEGLAEVTWLFDGPDEAYAKLDELYLAGEGAHDDVDRVLANRCSRVVTALFDAYDKHDEVAFLAHHAEMFTHDDRRTGIRHVINGFDELLPMVRAAWSMHAGRTVITTIAVRGDRLVLNLKHYLYMDPDGSEPNLAPQLIVDEMDEDGKICSATAFEPEDIDAAFAELDERFLAGEGAPHAGVLRIGTAQRDALQAGDWETYRSFIADDVVFIDHRQASLPALAGRDAVVEVTQGFGPLVRDLRMRVVTYHRLAPDLVLLEVAASATAQHGGDVAIEVLRLQQFRDGQVSRIELFPVDELEAALARFELTAERLTPSNRCSERVSAGVQAFNDRDWTQMARLLHPSVYFEDHRTGMGHSHRGRDPLVENAAASASVGAFWFRHEVLATRGETLVLSRDQLGNPDPDAGLFLDVLYVHEIDASGLLIAQLVFDDRAQAIDVLDERFASAEGAHAADVVRTSARSMRAWNDRDWEKFAELIAPDMVFFDHRVLASGDVHGREAVVKAVRGMVELSPDIRHDVVRIDELAPHACMCEVVAAGTNVTGAIVEFCYVQVTHIEAGLIHRIDRYALDQLDEARERFDDEKEDVLDNAAVRGAARFVDAVHRRDAEAFAGVLAADTVIEDRRAGLRNRIVGKDAVLAQAEEAGALGVTAIDFVVHAIRGDRLALIRYTYTGQSDFFVEVLSVLEVDAAGRHVASINFDPNDFDEALAELNERFAAQDASFDVIEVVQAFVDAFVLRDWTTMLETLAEDFVRDDRRSGLGGVVHGRVAFVDAWKQMEELGFVGMEAEVIATRGHDLALERIKVRSKDGFETELFIVIGTDAVGSMTFAVYFDLTDIDAAFAELDARYFAGAGAPVANWEPHLVTAFRAIGANDWDVLSSSLAPDLVDINHQPGLAGRVDGSGALIDGIRELRASGPDVRFVVSAIHEIDPDRALVTVEIRGVPGMDAADARAHMVYRLTNDRVTWMETYPTGDFDAARTCYDGLLRPETEAGAMQNTATRVRRAASEAFHRGDTEGFRRLHAPDCRLEDRRRGLAWVGVGPDAFLGHTEAVESLGVTAYHAECIATRGDRLSLTRRIMRSSPEVESFEISVLSLQEVNAEGLVSTMILFDLEDLDDAFAELDERYSQGEGSFASGIVRSGAEMTIAWNAQDWVTYAARIAPDARFVDHRPASSGEIVGREACVGIAKALVDVIPDVRHHWTAVHAIHPEVMLASLVVRGTNEEGGLVEIEYLQFAQMKGGLFTSLERYSPAQMDEALARFDEVTLSI